MTTRRGFLVMAGRAAALVAVTGVGVGCLPGDEGNGSGPPTIKFGDEMCARCKMVIGENPFAAGWRTEDGKQRHFDDIGCMVLDNGDLKPAAGTSFWVRDYRDESWIDATTATFLVDKQIKTPMAYGIAAFANKEAAAAAASQNAVTTTWAELPGKFEGRG